MKSLAEARKRIAGLGLSARQQQRWLVILETLMNAERDEGLSADELAQHAAFRRDESDDTRERGEQSEAQRVLRTLYDMAEAGLIEKRMLMSAFVRHQVKNASAGMLAIICSLERAMLDLLQQERFIKFDLLPPRITIIRWPVLYDVSNIDVFPL